MESHDNFQSPSTANSRLAAHYALAPLDPDHEALRYGLRRFDDVKPEPHASAAAVAAAMTSVDASSDHVGHSSLHLQEDLSSIAALPHHYLYGASAISDSTPIDTSLYQQNPYDNDTYEDHSSPNYHSMADYGHSLGPAGGPHYSTYADQAETSMTPPLTEEVLYVNPKQYARILKRRQQRARSDPMNPSLLIKIKQPFNHLSRHKHAMKRARGPGGRFLKRDEMSEVAYEHSSGHVDQQYGSTSSTDNFGSSIFCDRAGMYEQGHNVPSTFYKASPDADQ